MQTTGSHASHERRCNVPILARRVLPANIRFEVTRVLLVEDYRAFSEGLTHLLDQEPDLRVVGRTDSAAECRRYFIGR